MGKKIMQMAALIFVLSLLIAMTSSLGARNPGAQERLMRPRRQPSEIGAAHPAQSSWVLNYGRFFDDSDDDYD